jgi:hypothetical protein
MCSHSRFDDALNALAAFHHLTEGSNPEVQAAATALEAYLARPASLPQDRRRLLDLIARLDSEMAHRVPGLCKPGDKLAFQLLVEGAYGKSAGGAKTPVNTTKRKRIHLTPIERARVEANITPDWKAEWERSMEEARVNERNTPNARVERRRVANLTFSQRMAEVTYPYSSSSGDDEAE